MSQNTDSSNSPSPEGLLTADGQLEDLLTESLAPQALSGAHGIADADDLEALLGESMAAVYEAKATKAAQERLKRGVYSSTAERSEDAARIEAWRAAHEWEAVASVALFHEHRCLSCKSEAQVFGGLFVRELHRHLSYTQRWRRVAAVPADLPTEVALSPIEQPMCMECCTPKGWDVERCYGWGVSAAPVELQGGIA